jgi:Glycosyl transferase family 2/Methyltransferase domain
MTTTSLDPETRTQLQGWGPQALEEIRQARRAHQTTIAARRGEWIRSNEYFYHRLKRMLQFIVEPHKRVLEIRCEMGDQLASLIPSYGVGVEISDAMVECARQQHPELHFVRSDPEDLDLHETFDYILLNHIFDTVDILQVMERIRNHCAPETQLIVINYNYLWQPILALASKIGLRSRFVEPNWVSENDIRGFLKLAGFRPVRKHRLILSPKWLPVISSVMNDFLARLPAFRRLCLMQVMVARPLQSPRHEEDLTVSVIVPCRNEEGNVQQAAERIPAMGRHTEIIFCDDKSTDGTVAEVNRMQALYPQKDIRLVASPGICKAENVWTGFRAARGDVLMILDADLAVMPEELPMFLRALACSRGDFINGSRLVYPVQKNAMKMANLIGNKFFGLLFSFLLDQRIKDTLCGTKVFWRKDWMRLEPNLGTWGLKDLWGDYELLFGATKLHLEIAEVPVHYQERIHGVTKMTKVFSNGFRMLRICWYAWRRLEG